MTLKQHRQYVRALQAALQAKATGNRRCETRNADKVREYEMRFSEREMDDAARGIYTAPARSR